MTRTQTASERITEEVTSWPGVDAGPGRRGEFAFKVGRREIGHLHGDHAAHFSFPKDVWHELRADGRIADHPVFPGREGPAARRIEDESDVRDVIELLRLNYDRVVSRHGLPGGTDSPGSRHTITPHIVVGDAARAADWYKRVLGAEERLRIPAPGGKLMSVELRLGDSTIMLADEFPEMGIVSPQTLGGTYMALHLIVEDVDAVWQLALEAGAEVFHPLRDSFWGERHGQIIDPFGHRWGLAQRLRDVSSEEVLRGAEEMFAAASESG
jgi:PhnB protein